MTTVAWHSSTVNMICYIYTHNNIYTHTIHILPRDDYSGVALVDNIYYLYIHTHNIIVYKYIIYILPRDDYSGVALVDS